MNIVCISASRVPSDAANSLQAMKAVHGLAQLGHRATLIVPFFEGGDLRWESLSGFYGLKTPFTVERLKAPSRRLFFYAAVRRATYLKPDLLYVWPMQSAAFGLMHEYPVIMEMHDLPSGMVGPFWYRIFLYSGGQKRIAVITNALRKALEDQFGNQLPGRDVILAPNGVELERFENLPDPSTARRQLGLPEADTVVCTGHLYPGRGVDLFLDLAKRLTETRFVWVGGRDKDVVKFREQVIASRLENVTFSGFVHNADLPIYQAAADVLIMPYGYNIGISSGSGHSAEISSPMKMFEYLATGRAMLVSDLPVFREVLSEENAMFCPPENVEAWEASLQALLKAPDRRLKLAESACKESRKYSWIERERRILDGFVDEAR